MKPLATILLGLALLTAPFAVDAQPAGKVARIGYLSQRSGPSALDEAFRQGLRELGYVEGTNITVEYRWAGFSRDWLSPLRAIWSASRSRSS